MSASEIAALTVDQLQQIPAAMLSGLSVSQLQALTNIQLQALTVSQVDTGNPATGLTTMQITALGVKAASLSPAVIVSMSPLQIQALTLDAVSHLLVLQIMNLSAATLGAFTDQQISALTATQLHYINAWQADGTSRLVSANDNGLSAHDISILGAKAADLSAAVITGFDAGQLSALSADAIAVFTPEQIKVYVFASPSINLTTNQSLTITDGYHLIHGATGVEAIALASNSLYDFIDSAVEHIHIQAGKFGDFTFKAANDVLKIFNHAGIEVYDVQVNTSGSQLTFLDGSSYTAVLNHYGQISLTAISTSPTSNTGTTTTTSTPHLSENLTYTANFGLNDAQIKADISHALNNVFEYIQSNATMNIQVNAINQQGNLLADCGSDLYAMTMPQTPSANLTSLADYLIDTGKHYSSASPDAYIDINLANLGLANLDYTKATSSNQFDFTATIEHEIFHALAFNGVLGTSSAGGQKTAFDANVQMINGNPYFIGANAEAIYGGRPVPLAAVSLGQGSAYYHVAVSGDLMNAVEQMGTDPKVSALDLAILKDCGVPIVGSVNLAHFTPTLVA